MVFSVGLEVEVASRVVHEVVEDTDHWEHLGLEEAESVHGDLVRLVDGHGSHHCSLGGVPNADWADVSVHGPHWHFTDFDVSEESSVTWKFVDSGIGNTVPNMADS